MADKTPDQLGALTSLGGSDLLLVWSVLDGALRKMEAQVLIDLIIAAGGGTYLTAADNLSDLVDPAAGRSNLGLGTAAVQAVGAFLQSANNLSDLPNAATARTNLALGALATLAAVGTSQIDNLAVTNAKLAVGAALANLGYTPLNKAGDTATGQVNFSGAASAFTNLPTHGGNKLGYLALPANSQGSTYGFVADDVGKMVRHSSGSPHTWGIQTQATAGWIVGDTIVICTAGGGAITLSLAGGVNLIWGGSGGLTGSRTVAGYSMATLTYVDENAWIIQGAGIS